MAIFIRSILLVLLPTTAWALPSFAARRLVDYRMARKAGSSNISTSHFGELNMSVVTGVVGSRYHNVVHDAPFFFQVLATATEPGNRVITTIRVLHPRCSAAAACSVALAVAAMVLLLCSSAADHGHRPSKKRKEPCTADVEQRCSTSPSPPPQEVATTVPCKETPQLPSEATPTKNVMALPSPLPSLADLPQVVELRVVVLRAAEADELTSPLWHRDCVHFLATALAKGDGIESGILAFASGSLPFWAKPLGQPSLNDQELLVEPDNSAVSVHYFRGSRRASRSFEGLEPALREFLTKHRRDSSALDGGVSSLDFHECALQLRDEATVVGQLYRDEQGRLHIGQLPSELEKG